MPPTNAPAATDFDGILESLDAADGALRELYRGLADNPDLAHEYEAGLRELHSKRAELARQVGLAALAARRVARAVTARADVAPASSTETVATAPAEALVAAPSSDQPPPQLLAGEPIVDPEPGLEGEPTHEVVASSPPVPASETRVEPTAPELTPTSETPGGPSPAPVSARELQAFLAAATAPASAPRIRRTDDHSQLLALAAHVNVTAKVSTSGALDAEVDQLERAASEDRPKRWREMSRDAQVRWLSLLVAWAKALEQDAIRLDEPTFRVAAVFRDLRTFSKNDNPGFVHGFARSAAPRSATWRNDAIDLFRAIRPEPKPPAETKRAGPVKVPPPPEQAPEPEADDGLVDWTYRDRVRGLRVVLFGGEVREERRAALERAFQFASLEWVPRDRPRLVASLAERAASGTIDFVLVTKFVAHKETELITRSTKAPILTMRHGYGVTTVRQVLEEHFARADEKAAGSVAE